MEYPERSSVIKTPHEEVGDPGWVSGPLDCCGGVTEFLFRVSQKVRGGLSKVSTCRAGISDD